MAFLSPIFNLPFITDVDGNPLAGGHIYQYEGGSSSVLKTTFTSEDESVANENPIVLNSAGQLPAGIAIWLTEGEEYNLVLTEADGTTVLKGFDEVQGVYVPPVPGVGPSVIWVLTPGAVYLSPTSFLVTSNVVTEYAVGNRVRLTMTGGFQYGTVSSVLFSSPNTTVNIVNDGATLNPSLSAAEHSVLIAPGKTVDAAGVSYFQSLPYSTSGTVGNKLKLVDSAIATLNTRVDALRKVWTSSGTTTITISPVPAITAYSSDQVFTVLFTGAATGATTININGVGAASLKSYNPAGLKQDPIIAANTISDIAYDGADFILLDSAPPEVPVIPRGMQVFLVNGTFTVPADVNFVTVTCIGAGAGGGLAGANMASGGDWQLLTGGAGGNGGYGRSVIAVTPGTPIAITVGAGGSKGLIPYTQPTAGGSTTFNVSTVVGQGGAAGTNGYIIQGVNGVPGGATGQLAIPGANGGLGTYGNGGVGGTFINNPSTPGVIPTNGNNGLCVIEW